MKFNLRFARDTDLEKLRKAAKKIGADMMEVPEFKAQTPGALQDAGRRRHHRQRPARPLQVHVRPGNPAAIQSQAVKRLLGALPELGIELSQ